MSFGIPPLLNKAGHALTAVGLLVADAKILLRALGLQSPQWGIFLNNKQVIKPDSVLAFEYKKEYRLADYPMEQGAFQTYNKVTTPYDVRVSMTKGGSEVERQAFLLTAERIAASLDLYDVLTPERKYSNANISHFDYRRTSTNGVTLLTVDFWLAEIRVTVPAAFSNTKNPSSQINQNGGLVQPAPITTTANPPQRSGAPITTTANPPQ